MNEQRDKEGPRDDAQQGSPDAMANNDVAEQHRQITTLATPWQTTPMVPQEQQQYVTTAG